MLHKTVSTLTVGDSVGLLSRNNIIAVLVFAILIGLAINKSGRDGEKFYDFLESATKVLFKFIDIVFLYAPFGLGCYFAALVGTYGSTIAVGYLKTFLI